MCTIQRPHCCLILVNQIVEWRLIFAQALKQPPHSSNNIANSMSTSSSSSEYLVYPCCVRLSKFPTKLLIDGFEVPEPLVTGSGISCFLSVTPVWEAHECLVLLVEKHEILRRIEYPAHFCRIGNFMTGYLHLKIVASSHQWGAFDQWGPLHHCVRNVSLLAAMAPDLLTAGSHHTRLDS